MADLRGERGYSQKALAARATVHANTVARVEKTGLGHPTTIAKIARALNVAVDDLRASIQARDPQLQQLVRLFHRLLPEARAVLVQLAKLLVKDPPRAPRKRKDT